MKLQVLRLNGTNVSDIGILSGLESLQLLDLSGTEVSDEQIAELKKALPKLEIVR
jgi:Leucine-rich repeat (LRR) protein